jgi:hypothetical protein
MGRMDQTKPWLEERLGRPEIHCGTAPEIVICCSANQVIELHKIYGPLAANGVRIRLEYTNDVADWVVERETGDTWAEAARFPCQDPEEQCSQCGATVEGAHGCEGVPGGFSDEPA